MSMAREIRLLKKLTDIVFYGLLVWTAASLGLAAFLAYTVPQQPPSHESAAFSQIDVPIGLVSSPGTFRSNTAGLGSAEIVPETGIARFTLPLDLPGFALMLFLGLLKTAPALVVLELLRRTLGAIVDGDPFAAVNALRITWIGLVIMAAQVVEAAAGFGVMVLAGEAAYSPGTASLVRPAFGMNLSMLFLGLLIVALGEVFRHGSRLQTDVDLTV
jgi:hypothetical protein